MMDLIGESSNEFLKEMYCFDWRFKDRFKLKNLEFSFKNNSITTNKIIDDFSEYLTALK